jgi:UDP-GlcNAc:undecaprenyl-phosphate GlcNAc-1-phosphate transferase
MTTSWSELWQRYPDIWRMVLPSFLISFSFIGACYSWIQRVAKYPDSRWAKLPLLPGVRARDVHTTAKPRIGGLAMWLTIVLMLAMVGLSGHTSEWLNFKDTVRYGNATALGGLLAGMVVIFLFGLWDDLYSLKPVVQLTGQILAALCLVFGGIGVQYIRLPNGSPFFLDHLTISLPTWLGAGDVWLWSALFTIVWVLLTINVMNFFDGLDGLAGTIATTAAAMLFFVSMRGGFIATGTLALILMGTVAGFIPWNWHPSKLFMGTIGSQLLGFLLAIIAIISGGKVATAVLVLGIPIFDALVVIGRRLSAGESAFKADQRHLHHRLLKAGLSVPAVVILLNAVGLIFGVLAVVTQDSTTKGYLTLLVAIFMLLFILLSYYLEQGKSNC